jgi:hypothetical protein
LAGVGVRRLEVLHELAGVDAEAGCDLEEVVQVEVSLMLEILAHDLYLRANPTQRRFINQAIFAAMWVSHEDVERAELLPPFDDYSIIKEANWSGTRLTASSWL